MKEYTVTPGGSNVDLEDGGYDAVITAIDEGVQTQFGSSLKFHFFIEDEECEMTALCSDPARFTPNTKLHKWASAVLGRELAEGEPFNLGMLIDKRCRILVANEKNEKGDVWAKVKNVTARKNGKKRAKVEESDEDPF